MVKHSSNMKKIVFSVLVHLVLVQGNVDGHKGIYSDELHIANLIIPRKVNHFGEHLSHDLNHHHNHSYELFNDEIVHEERAENAKQVHYRIECDNETLHLELEPSTSFVAPLMIIERHKRDLRERRKRPQSHTQCHYQGRIRGHHNSKVAVSACNGLAGYIRTNKNEYWIEPSKNHEASANGHPHLIYHRSAVKSEQDRKLQQRKKKKKRKRRHASNCGTKEAKSKETKIEWQPMGKVIVQGGRKTRNHHDRNDKPHNNLNKDQRQKGKKRITRSIVTPRHVEALVVADSSMMLFHEGGDVETYLLTIMNMVSSLYKDPTIGNFVQVVVVKIILQDDEEEAEQSSGLNVTHVASSTLESFCRWQRPLNPKKDDDPHHYDVAILVTRKNICSANGCSTLGVANVGGMCRPDRSCSVNEDNGITLAHTITHELGHNFGMYHDTAKTGCDHRSGPILHIMTPSFEADTVQVNWSNCSRRDITHFLDQGLGKCLEDPPTQQEYMYPELPPGAMYNANLQCRLQFNSTDESITVCSKLDEICSQLWCLVDGICTTLLRPAAPGTNCFKHKWCQNQKCVPIEDPKSPVDGKWGDWSEYSNCSRTCDAGVAKQTRECDHPAPAHGGTFCIGERARYKICNVDKCVKDEPSFRAQQCTDHDADSIKGRSYTWLPYFDAHEPCELYCTDSEDTMIMSFGEAGDGTSCNIGTNDMCIGGICRKVGCDWIVDSNTTEDLCGICAGNGETCNTIKGEFTKKVNMSDGYYEITLMPSGSRHILVEELGPSKNYIGVGKANSKEFYLNGDRFISMSGEYDIAGTVGLYDRDNEKESLKIPGPIKEDMSLYIIFKGKHKNLGIRYEYTLSSNSTAETIYYWKLTDWSTCSKTCGTGVQTRDPVCYKRWEGVVDDEFCWKNAENKRQEKTSKSCNENGCPYRWWIGKWQPCSCPLNGELTPIKHRNIICVEGKDSKAEMALPDSRCEFEPKPIDVEPCNSILPLCKLEEKAEEKLKETLEGKMEEINPSDNEINNSI